MNTKFESDTKRNAPEILIDERTAAARLSLCTRTLFDLRQRGELPFVKVGAKILYSPDDLSAFAEARKQRALP